MAGPYPNAVLPAPVVALIASAIAIIEEDEQEEYERALALARIAAARIIEDEEGVLFDEESWVFITVNIAEYHMMGDPCFKLHFRMTRGVFEALVQVLWTHLKNMGRLRRERSYFPDNVLMVVWLLATPDTFRSVALRFGVRPSTLYYHYSYIIEALRELSPQYITWPTAEQKEEIKGKFERATGFPGIIGCIDGTHIEMTAPVQDPAAYFSRHHSYSINVQAVVDSDLLVRDLHVGEPGSMHDTRVFRRSPLYAKLLRGEGINADTEHLVGDGGYTLTDFMMIPYPHNGHLTPLQKNYNKRLSQCRVRVENSFGKAKGLWRRLKFIHNRNQVILVDHITACFVLHNFLVLNGEQMLDEEELARVINENQVLGNDDREDDENAGVGGDNDDYEDDVDVHDAAQVRGIEKRLFLTNDVLAHLL